MKSFASASFRQYGQIRPPLENAITHAGRGGSEETMEMLGKKIVDLSSRLAAKDELANQQSRIAKDAVEDLIKKDEQLKQHVLALKEEKSAREQAEAVYLSLKQELDKACQQKGMVEARTMQLNGALKDCMDEMQHVKDQLEQKAQESTSRKREWDKLRNELEMENAQLKRQLMEATAENIAISKSLQERGRSINEIIETRAKVESESRILQVQIESLHKDIDAYKYEIHVLKKEIQIRNDEKEQNRKLADAAHKQHLENVKKIAKLDSECNRLRLLVRKKLPGPAAIAQMRVESDHVGKKRLPSPKMTPDQRDIDALNGRLVAMEDETKLLKESLAKKTAELQVARQLCARTVSRLSSAESILETMARGQALPTLCNDENHATPCSSKSDPMQQQSLAALYSPAPLCGGGETMEVMDWALSSEDGNNNDDELSSAESWASALIHELSHVKKDDGNPTPKVDETGKVGIRIIGPTLHDFDFQTTLQELNAKLSSIGESILALPSSMRCVGDQGFGNESKPLSFLMLGQIMEEFAFVKQLLVELQRAKESDQTNQSGKRLQGSNKNKTDGLLVIDECNEDIIPLDVNSEKVTFQGYVRKIIEVLSVSADQSKLENSVESGAEGVFVRLQKVVDALNADDLRQLSELSAVELLCNVGDLVKGHCTALWAPAVVIDTQNLGEETGRSKIDMSVGDVTLDNRETGALRSDHGLISGTDENGRSLEIKGDMDVMDSSYEALDGHEHIPGLDAVGDGAPDVGEIGVVNKIDVGKHGVNSVIDNKPYLNEAEGKLNSNERALQIEVLQNEVERLSRERDELAVKLAASQGQLEQQLARVATLDAESLLLASEKASLAHELSDAAARNHGLEEELAEARASLDDLRQEVSSLTSELAEQAVRCQELQGSVLALSDVGTRFKESRFKERTLADDSGGICKQRKEHEIASAKVQLAECQRTILVLGSQLRALSSAQDSVAAEPSFDSSLESATSTDQISLPPMAVADAYGSGHVADRTSRRAQAGGGYVRTRGGRLVTVEQYWGSSSSTGDVPVAGGPDTPSRSGYSGSNVALPRYMYGVACAQTPLHEYATEQSAHAYSPPETAMSSPATSPARYIPRSPPVSSVNNLLKASNEAAAAATGAASFPTRKHSRIARFFARAKTAQR